MGLTPGDLPQVLRLHGFVPAVVAAVEGPLWAGRPENEYKWHAEFQLLLGRMPDPCLHDVYFAGDALRGP
eukprot:15077343-Alexandrium_andersonii.AAC.1